MKAIKRGKVVDKFLEYAGLKEARLREVLGVVEVSLIVRCLRPKMFKSGAGGYDTVLETGDAKLLLEEVAHSRIIGALRKLGVNFYDEKLQQMRNELYRENQGLLYKAVLSVTGTKNDDLLANASVYFLEAIDNLLPTADTKPQTYVYSFVVGRLKDHVTSQKKGFLLLTYLKRYCGFENAEELIVQGKVKVNGCTCYNKKQVVSLEDEILVDGEKTAPVGFPSLCDEEAFLSPDGELERKELWKAVKQAVGEEKAEVLFFYCAGFSVPEIADEFGYPPEKVRGMIRSAVAKLRERKDEFAGFAF